MSMNKTCPISNFTPDEDSDGIDFYYRKTRDLTSLFRFSTSPRDRNLANVVRLQSLKKLFVRSHALLNFRRILRARFSLIWVCLLADKPSSADSDTNRAFHRGG